MRAAWPVALVVTALLAAAPGAGARDLRVGLAATATTLDPHFLDTSPNAASAAHVFDRLVHLDGRQRARPGLATSWRAIDARVWEFELRQGVRFHDGTIFEARDVAASFARVRRMAASPAPFGQYLRPVEAVEIVSPTRIRIRTTAPFPLLPAQLALINIVSHRFADADTAAFNAGEAAIGTGPFRLARWSSEGIELAANPEWWGGAPAWGRVTIRAVPREGARVAALMAGDVDVIDQVPPIDAGPLAARGFAIHRAASGGLMYIHLDSARDVSPFVTGRDGAAIANPLRDRRVRLALSLAINRPALIERLFAGAAIPAGGIVPPGFPDATDDPPPAFDLDRARALLAEAGLPDGFALRLNGPNDRYPQDEQAMQAIAAMWSRLGVDARVEAQPVAITLARASRLEFSAFLYGGGSQTADSLRTLRNLLGTFDPSRGSGATNRGRYSNPALDALIDRAETTMDEDSRGHLAREATRIAIGDVGVIALYHPVWIWASRRSVTGDLRADGQFRAVELRPAP